MKFGNRFAPSQSGTRYINLYANKESKNARK